MRTTCQDAQLINSLSGLTHARKLETTVRRQFLSSWSLPDQRCEGDERGLALHGCIRTVI